MALDNDRKFKIYIKAEGQGNWYEIGHTDSIANNPILSNNYGDGSPGPATLANEDVGMKINTTTTFTANDGDEICIISHNNSGNGAVDGTVSSHRILKLEYAQSQDEANYKLKLCKSDVITLNGAWQFYELTGGVPIGTGGAVTSMAASVSSTSIDTTLKILIGKNNKGWNVSILGQNLGMGYQGKVYFPRIESGEIDHGTSGMHDYKDIKAPILEHSQPVNIKNNSKSGYTMLGWYKSWTRAFPKLVDPFNIISSVYYYNSADNQYIKLAENTGPDGHSDGKSSEAGNGNRAKVWNIATNLGSTPAIWVKVSKELTDFETSGGSSNATTNPKAPFVFLTYSG